MAAKLGLSTCTAICCATAGASSTSMTAPEELSIWSRKAARGRWPFLAIRGGNAGGCTTLSALTAETCFIGASHYGVSDLEALARDTLKFSPVTSIA